MSSDDSDVDGMAPAVTGDSSSWSIEDHPEYARFHLPEDGFSFWWQVLNAVGWTFLSSSGRYRAPKHPDGSPGRIFESAKDVIAYLNSFAIPNVYTNLQWANDNDVAPNGHDDTNVAGNNSEQSSMREHEIGTTLRKAVLQKACEKKRNLLENQSRWTSTRTETSSQGAASTNNNNNTSTRTRPTRRAATLKSRTTTTTGTVTALEKGADLYLRRNTKGKRGTSQAGNALTSPASMMSIAECQQFIQSEYPMEQVEQIEEEYRSNFAKWRFLLSTNHSLLFYGAGSKRELLNSFAETELNKEGKSLVIDGTDKDVTVEAILDILVQICLDGNEPQDLSSIKCLPENVPVTGKYCPLKSAPVVERAIMIGRGLAHAVEESDKPIPPTFLVIHSLDAQLATSVDQDALAMLVINSTVKNGVAALRLAASVNHVDAPTFLWSPVTEANFAWFPCCVHTHRPFVQELDLIEEDGAQKKRTEKASRTNTQARRILDVLQNLAPRHTEVVQLLARLQNNRNNWVDYLKYRERCKSACAINKDSQLRALLRELMDHGLVVSKTEGSKEMVQIPFDLQEIIEFKRS